MIRTRWVVSLLVLLTSAAARAQDYGARVELFGTAGAVAGFTPVRTASGSHVDGHAGVRIDGGLQFSRFGLGLGGRYWQMSPTEEYGGSGIDVFVLGEWRPGFTLRTIVRATVGAGSDDFDPGHGPDRPTITTNGFVWSVGVGHELIVPSGARIVLSADLLMPTTTPGPIGRRSPVFELGIGYRGRFYQSISPLPR